MADDTPEASGAGERDAFDRGRVDEVIYGQFGQPPLEFAMSEDGLPQVKPPHQLPLAPPLDPSTLVCLADRSEYVLRDRRWGEVLARFAPSEVKIAENGEAFVDFLDAVDRGARWFEVLRRMELVSGRLPVEPLRPQCKFLARQLVDFQDSTDHVAMERLCTARRDEDSFFLTVRDSQVHACELRVPRARVSQERMDRFDDTKIELGRQRREDEDIFDVDAALEGAAREASEGTARGGGIFKQ